MRCSHPQASAVRAKSQTLLITSSWSCGFLTRSDAGKLKRGSGLCLGKTDSEFPFIVPDATSRWLLLGRCSNPGVGRRQATNPQPCLTRQSSSGQSFLQRYIKVLVEACEKPLQPGGVASTCRGCRKPSASTGLLRWMG